jgi:hypothetical protein
MAAFAFHLASLQIIRRNYSFPSPFQETCFTLKLSDPLCSIAPDITETSYSYTSRKLIGNSGKEKEDLFPHKELQDIARVTSYLRSNSMLMMNFTNFYFLPSPQSI